MRALVLVPGRLVETLQASPLVRTLVAGIEDVQVTVACSPIAAEVAHALEGVTEVLPLPGLDPEGSPLAWLSAWAQLRRRRFDTALVCGSTARARLLPYLAGIPRRVGPGGGLTRVLLGDHVAAAPGENRAVTWLRLVGALGVTARRNLPRLDPGTGAEHRALVQLHSTGIADGRLLVALAPGTHHSDIAGVAPRATAWAPDRWAHLANLLGTRHGAAIVFVGASADRIDVADALEDVDALHVDLTGQLDSLGMAALLRHCDLMVSGDSPLLHLAAAVGTPTVGLFGPTDGHRRGPFGEEHRVVQAVAPRQARAHAAVMEQIRVEDVLAGIEASL